MSNVNIKNLSTEQLRERMDRVLKRFETERAQYANKFGRMSECYYKDHKMMMDISISTGKRLNTEYKERTGNDYDFHFID